MHHLTLKSAVNKYSPLAAEGKTEAEIKAEIGKDEKGFGEEEINEIYAAVKVVETGDEGDDKTSKKSGQFIVITPFRDVNNFHLRYDEGDDVSHFEADRLEYCVNIGLVEKKV